MLEQTVRKTVGLYTIQLSISGAIEELIFIGLPCNHSDQHLSEIAERSYPFETFSVAH